MRQGGLTNQAHFLSALAALRRREIRHVRAVLYRAAQEGLARQNRAGHPHFVAQLRGKIARLNMVRPVGRDPK